MVTNCCYLSTPRQALPDALRGEQWAFVQLPLGTLQQMLKRVEAVSGRRGAQRTVPLGCRC